MSEGIGPGEEAVEFQANNTQTMEIREENSPLTMTRIGPEEARISGLTDKQIAGLSFVKETVQRGSELTKEFILIDDGSRRESGRDLPTRWGNYSKIKG